MAHSYKAPRMHTSARTLATAAPGRMNPLRWHRRLLVSLALAAGYLLAPGCGDTPLVEVPEDTGMLGVVLDNVAVVTSDNERVEEVLDAFGVAFSLYDGFVYGPPDDAPLSDRYTETLPPIETLLAVEDALYPFDVVFLDCGARGLGNVDPQTLVPDTSLLTDAVVEHVRTFVEYGGQLYLSDRSFPLLERAWPELAIFQGDDLSISDPLQGAPGTVEALIQDPALSDAAELQTVRITFPYQAWALMEAAEGVVLRGDVPVFASGGGTTVATLRPLLIRAERGAGAVMFASFHQEHRLEGDWTTLQAHLLRRLGGSTW